jgi:hypothetical protein
VTGEPRGRLEVVRLAPLRDDASEALAALAFPDRLARK